MHLQDNLSIYIFFIILFVRVNSLACLLISSERSWGWWVVVWVLLVFSPLVNRVGLPRRLAAATCSPGLVALIGPSAGNIFMFMLLSAQPGSHHWGDWWCSSHGFVLSITLIFNLIIRSILNIQPLGGSPTQLMKDLYLSACPGLGGSADDCLWECEDTGFTDSRWIRRWIRGPVESMVLQRQLKSCSVYWRLTTWTACLAEFPPL